MTYHIIYHYFNNSKICQKYKNSLIVKEAQFQNYPNKSVGEDTFCSYYVSYNYFKNSPKIPK